MVYVNWQGTVINSFEPLQKSHTQVWWGFFRLFVCVVNFFSFFEPYLPFFFSCDSNAVLSIRI